MTYIYMLRCRNGALYTGMTENLKQRMQLHKDGIGSKYVRANVFKELVYYEDYPTWGAAAREIQVKNYPRIKKEAMIDDLHKHINKIILIKSINTQLH